MSDHRPDVVAAWRRVHTHMATLVADFTDRLELLATNRDAAETLYTVRGAASNPAWTLYRSELDKIEDLAPCIAVDLIGWSHGELAGAADDYTQYWTLDLALGLGALAISADTDDDATALDSQDRFLDACSVVIDYWMGAGGKLQRDTLGDLGIEGSQLTAGRWATAGHGDTFVTSGYMLLRLRMRWRQASD